MSEKPEQKKFNNFLEKIKQKQKNINMSLFEEYFNYKSPDKMLKYVHSLETTDDYNKVKSLIDKSFINFGDKVKVFQKAIKKTTE